MKNISYVFWGLIVLVCGNAFAAAPTIAPERMRNLRMLEANPFLFEYHRVTMGEEPQFFAYPKRDTTFRKNFDETEKDALFRLGGSDFRIAASITGGLDYRGGESLGDTIWPGIDGGLFVRGYIDSVDFSLDARMYVESHSAKRPKAWDHEVFDEQFGDIEYVSYSRYRGQVGVNWNRFRLNVGRDVLHWGPGFYNNLTLNQFALPYTFMTLDVFMGPLHIVSAYGDLRVGEISWDDINQNERNMYAHRYELALGNLTLGVSELQVIYNDSKPLLMVPIIPLFIEKGNFSETSNNGSISVDANYRLLRFARIYSEFMLDDMESPDELFKNERNNCRWGFMAGLQLAHDFQIASKKFETGTVFEASRVEPYTYVHHDSAKAQLANLNHPIGNPNGPNSMNFDWLMYTRYQHVFASVLQRFYWKGTSGGSSINDVYEGGRTKHFLKGAKMQYSITPSVTYEGQYTAFTGSITFVDDPQVYLRVGFKW
ncbi:MAG: hypothetical protein MJY87_01690 [Fibrobacter sp.]|nr:hypothetical protein [Fibrobacter sp.]